VTFLHELYVKMSHFQVIFVTKFQCDSSHRKNVKRAVIKHFIVTNQMMFCDTIYILLCDESHIIPIQITFINVNFYISECSFHHILLCDQNTFQNVLVITFLYVLQSPSQLCLVTLCCDSSTIYNVAGNI
jgi:hypothetical protein